MNEKQLISALHEQLAIWMKESQKKDKWNYYSETAKVLKQAEVYLAK